MKPVFIHVSKAAGTSIVSSAGDSIVNAGHRTAASWVTEHGRADSLFAVVRHPLDRVISEYFFRRCRWRSGELNPHLFNLDLSFDDWVMATYAGETYRTRSFFERTGIEFVEHSMVNDVYLWFLPQVGWLCGEDGELLIHDVLRFETLAADWSRFSAKQGLSGELVHANAAARDPGIASSIAPRTHDVINEYFADDFERFGYELTGGVKRSMATVLRGNLHAAGARLTAGSIRSVERVTRSRIAPSPAQRPWAGIRFHQTKPAEPTEEQRQMAKDIYQLQDHDDRRFDARTPALLSQLDLSGGAVIATTCDHRFAALFENWAASCDRSQIDVRSKTIVFATDEQAFERAQALGFVAYYDVDSELLDDMGHSTAYGSAQWTKFMFHQNWVIKKVLQLGVDVLFQDADLVWHKNPIPLLARRARSGADVQAMYDGPNGRFQPLFANSGFMYFRNTHRVRAFWDEVYARHDMVAHYRSQQEPLNVLLAVHAQRGLEVQVLDEERFANGHLYTGGRLKPPPAPWVVHHSWTETLQQKLERYRAHGMWYVDD